MQDLLIRLRDSPEFKQIMEGLKSKRPIVPSYKPHKTRDETENHIETIKYTSAQADGFDLLFYLLTGRKP